MMTGWQRDLSRLPGVARVEHTNGNHLRLVLTNGTYIIASGSPGRHGTSITRADIKRALIRTRGEGLRI
jgi:hypothetical protein